MKILTSFIIEFNKKYIHFLLPPPEAHQEGRRPTPLGKLLHTNDSFLEAGFQFGYRSAFWTSKLVRIYEVEL